MLTQKKNYTEYQREYHRNRYQSDPIIARQYQRSIKIKKQYNIPKEQFEKYRHQLGNVVNLLKLMQKMPESLILEIINEKPNLIPNFEITEED
jgi:deoxyadenosine/deoxycytidine kinase